MGAARDRLIDVRREGGILMVDHIPTREESNLCECGQRETVKHVVLDCRLWSAERQELRATLEDKKSDGAICHTCWEVGRDERTPEADILTGRHPRGNRT